LRARQPSHHWREALFGLSARTPKPFEDCDHRMVLTVRGTPTKSIRRSDAALALFQARYMPNE
jgi:hypothetical protein